MSCRFSWGLHHWRSSACNHRSMCSKDCLQAIIQVMFWSATKEICKWKLYFELTKYVLNSSLTQLCWKMWRGCAWMKCYFWWRQNTLLMVLASLDTTQCKHSFVRLKLFIVINVSCPLHCCKLEPLQISSRVFASFWRNFMSNQACTTVLMLHNCTVMHLQKQRFVQIDMTSRSVLFVQACIDAKSEIL